MRPCFMNERLLRHTAMLPTRSSECSWTIVMRVLRPPLKLNRRPRAHEQKLTVPPSLVRSSDITIVKSLAPPCERLCNEDAWHTHRHSRAEHDQHAAVFCRRCVPIYGNHASTAFEPNRPPSVNFLSRVWIARHCCRLAGWQSSTTEPPSDWPTTDWNRFSQLHTRPLVRRHFTSTSSRHSWIGKCSRKIINKYHHALYVRASSAAACSI